MRRLIGWLGSAGIHMNDGGKSPWGQRPGGEGDKGSGDGEGKGAGPRNPWTMPPGARPGPAGPSTLESLLRRSRGGGGGGGFGGFGGGAGLPGGMGLWVLIGLGLIALWVVITSFHSIGPRERGVVTVLGRYTNVLQPGAQFTLPAPFARVKIVNVDGVRTENFPEGQVDNLVLTQDQNIVDLSYSVRWNVKNPEDYVFAVADPDGTVRAVAESAMRAAIANVSLDQALGAGRETIEIDAQRRMQAILDSYNSGVNVLGVALKPVNPPAAVDDAFKAVTAAQQKAQADLNDARAYAQSAIAAAQGDAAQFDKIYAQYKLAPDVTRRRLYYETMEAVLAKSNKVIVEPRGVAPYIPLPALTGKSGGAPAPAPTPAPQQGGGQ